MGVEKYLSDAGVIKAPISGKLDSVKRNAIFILVFILAAWALASCTRTSPPAAGLASAPDRSPAAAEKSPVVQAPRTGGVTPPLPVTPTPPATTPTPPAQTAPAQTAPAQTAPAVASLVPIVEPPEDATPAPIPLACLQDGGTTESGSLRDTRLPLPLEYFVHLPPCYAQLPEQRYPVLYLIHGQNYNNDQWDRLGADEMADRLASAGEISPFILVLPRDRSWAQPAEDHFGQAVIEKLLPTIDETYRTLPSRQYRAIGGLSRGAGWAIHLGLQHPELFSAIGAHSLPVFWTDTGHVRAWLDAIPDDSMPRIFMDTGDKDYLIKSTLWFERILVLKGIPHEWYLFPGYHEEAYWQAHLEQYIRWYAQDW